jgi:hypothetical protein
MEGKPMSVQTGPNGFPSDPQQFAAAAEFSRYAKKLPWWLRAIAYEALGQAFFAGAAWERKRSAPR